MRLLGVAMSLREKVFCQVVGGGLVSQITCGATVVYQSVQCLFEKISDVDLFQRTLCNALI